MSLVVQKLSKDNFIAYQNKILNSLKEEYKTTYNIVFDKHQLSQLKEYCLSYMYVLVFIQSNKPKLIGYFSLSSTDLNKPYNFIRYIVNCFLKNVYLFDVYIYPKYRRKGIGTYLVRKSIDTARKEFKANNIYLYTKSTELTTFYNKNNFNYIKDVKMDTNNLFLFLRKING